MGKFVTCRICGAQFETSRPNKRYCSFICKEAGRKLRRMEWEEANPDYNKEYMRYYRRKEGEQDEQKAIP